MALDIRDLNSLVKESSQHFDRLKAEVSKALVGQHYLLDRLCIALLTDGHILLEGLPGLAKTLSITSLAKALDCEFKRIQFTPDLLPADLIGTTVYNPKSGEFNVKQGPVFTNFVLADEVNRAPPKVQSALLEVMGERQVTLGGQTFEAAVPFLVLATQNPVEQEGTYPLPEAQTDRFMMKVKVGYPNRKEEEQILHRMANLRDKTTIEAVLSLKDLLEMRKLVDDIYIDEKVNHYILDIIFATRTPKDAGVEIQDLLDFGASPRASIALSLASKAHAFLSGRGFVTPHDVKSMAHDVLRHRLRLSYEAEAEEITSDDVVDKILETLPVP